MARGKTKIAWILIILLVAAVALGWLAWYHLFREAPQQLADDSVEEYFKYGSIGTEDAAGVPYWIWLSLPQMFPEYLPRPGGYAALGFPWEQGREMPMGFSKRTIGYERVGINCAFCHASAVRTEDDVVPRYYLGGPGNTMNVLAYQRFLFDCASDPRFNADAILGTVGTMTELSFTERLLYRYLLIPGTRKALLEDKEEFAWTESRPDWGRGRIDPFNPVKVAILDVDVGETLGNSDMQPIWNLRPRLEGDMAFHWDGLNTDLTEVFLSSALGDGATSDSLPVEELDRMQQWLMDLEPPGYEDVFGELAPVDTELAAAGESLYQGHCARCHAMDGEQTGQVLPLSKDAWQVEEVEAAGRLWTDPHRAEMWTPEAAQAYNDYAEGYPWKLEHFRSTGGYVNVPLDGLWIRAPYLHNGSVPYLAELLELPEDRTQAFYRGYDLYDPERMGFVSEGMEAERVGTRYDVTEPGNSNEGHLWGTQLAPDEKAALLEYLKSL